MRQPEKFQTYAYFAICLGLVLGHELIFSLYAGQGRFIPLTIQLVVLFSVAAVVDSLVSPRLETLQPFARRRVITYAFDFGLYLLVALLLLLVEVALLGRPFGVSVDIAIGIGVFGYFAALDNALKRQLGWFRRNEVSVDGSFTLVPMAQKFSIVMTLTILILAVTISLSSYRLIHSAAAENVDQLPLYFLLEVMFIFGALLALLLRLINSYTRNIHAFLQEQMNVLRSVQKGDLDQRAPIMSQDELGLMAVQINAMIENLRDRDRLHKTLERVVGSNIMEKLLSTDDDALKRGQEDEVAIMFCDMRDFTSMSEAASAEEVILFLNNFFSDLSDIVSSHNGTINKFMGDAVLAVYGLESESNPVEDAVMSVFKILEHTRQFMLPDGSHPDMGAGIHFGKVMAGTIGSEQRYEYTFLGDAVNTASRLEGLTKRLGYRIVLSSEGYLELPESVRHRFTDLGPQRVRGKSEPIHVYGTEPKSDKDQ
ncbi:MAG: adenylate/guanylate cyclase domain-containing protein [Gammaproteobacteria bacterium]|nr:MAG: adenylate/guanylate cyclase domain-containing protein [Gammaproteobacteria bacterium]